MFFCMSKKNGYTDQMLIKLYSGEKQFLKKHNVYGRKAVDYIKQKIISDRLNDEESNLLYEIEKSKLAIRNYEKQLEKERLWLNELECKLSKFQKVPVNVRDNIIKCMNDLYDAFLAEHKDDGYDCSLEHFFEDKISDIGIIGLDNNYLSDDEVIEIYQEYFYSVSFDDALSSYQDMESY